MNQVPQIKYLRNHEIDKTKWDTCINEALNTRIYALSVYLDNMASNWDALVAGDYDIVMPLPWRKKFGIHYIYQPAFTQQLGLFSMHELNATLTHEFLKQIPRKFRYWHIGLNAGNIIANYNFHLCKNYLLQLKSYNIIADGYNRNTKRNIKKATASGITISENCSPVDTVTLHRKRFKDTVGANDNDYKNLVNLFAKLSGDNSVFSVCAKNKYDVIIATSTYLLHSNRIIFLLNGNLRESLDLGAAYLLKDYVIKKFSDINHIMDFEGSDHIKFAQFYEHFGAKEIEYYPVLTNNRLPWPIKFLKRNSTRL